ncbi:acyltransferase [Mycolicibacterium pulveris]|uniref:Acyltransferase n=1 Tax=Mycolicibacterium pulveris TaxID=36813 RepID=A0A7I7UJJ0_MYCPV|nr:acyltransferase [Mycolicibacterium pulveris]MCV6980229.1 acyltransferase [Mycolicibacterium pulveris]BBY81614.1 acyltransferase [Mycolicibacterium pulveris]
MTTEATKGAAPSAPSTSPDLDRKAKRARIIGLDGVRGLLCLSIAITHVTGYYTKNTADTWKTNLFGFSLVYFFVLSGFLLFLPYVRNLVAVDRRVRMPNVRDYTIHRLARIMPAYLVIFLIVNFVLRLSYRENAALMPDDARTGIGMITDPGELLANLALVQTYFPAYIQTGIGPSWSLTLEYAFYLTLPLLGWVIFRMRRRAGRDPYLVALVAPAILLGVGVLGRALTPLVNRYAGASDFILLNWGPNIAAVFTRSLLANADNFAMGMFAAVVFVAIEHGALADRVARRVRVLSAAAILPVLIVGAALFAVAASFVTAVVGVVAALMILVVVVPLARGQKSKLARALDVRPIRYVGEISLSAYLWHFPLLLLLGQLGWMAGDTLPGMLYNIAVLLGVTVLAASVTYYLIEKPAMNYARSVRATR